MPKKKANLVDRAKLEARLQLDDLLHEAQMLLELFPDLRDSYDPDELPVKFLLKRGAARASARMQRVAAGARKRASAAQKAR